MPRSWLSQVTDVRQIGGQFYRPKAGEPWDEKQDLRSEERWLKAGVQPIPVEGIDRLFFGSSMHDSEIVAIDRTKDVLRLRLNSTPASDFAAIYADAVCSPRPEGPWPVELVFREVEFVRAARVDPEGKLRFEEITNLEGAEFLYDWFWNENDRLQWIAQAYTRAPDRGALSREVYLMVDCGRASALDLCPAAMQQAFGETGRSLYEEARSNGGNVEEPFNLWNEAGLRRTLPPKLLVRTTEERTTRSGF